MKLRNFTKFFTGIALISALPVGVVISNPHTHTHSSLVVGNKATNDISWSIDGKGNIWPTDRSKVSGEITIPNTVDGKVVTGIANSAFEGCSLKSVNFAEGSKLNSIGTNSFESCASLTSVNFDNDSQLTTIGAQAFFNCCSLKTIAIPSGVNSIGFMAFNSCTSLKNINIPNNVTSIGDYAFGNCDILTDVYLSWDENQIKKLQIDDYVFDSTRGQITINFHIPKGMKKLYITQAKDWFDNSVVPNWIEDNSPAPSSNSNLPLILGLTFGFIILIGIGSYLGYRYYKHRKAINKK